MRSLYRLISRETVLAPLALLLIAGVAFRSVLTGVSFATFQDNTYLFLPIFTYASKTFSALEYPYWINGLVGGIPLFDTPQFTFDYPFYFLRLGLYNSAVTALTLVHYITLLHYFFALTNTYVLLRVLRINVGAALFGAATFAFSANLVSYLLAVTLIAPYSWLPLFIASLVMLDEPGSRRRGFFLCIFSTVMVVLAAPSLPFIHCIFIGAVISLALMIRHLRQRNPRRVLEFAAAGLCAGMLAFVILSPYLVSEFRSMPGFIRWTGNGPPIVGNVRMPFESFLLGQLSLDNLLDVIAPRGSQFLIGNPFFGFGASLFALLALNVRNRTPVVYGFGFLAVWGLCSALGSNLGFAYVNYRVPFVNLMREPCRHLLVFAFAASVLSAFGLDYLLTNIDKGRAFFLTRTNILCFAIVTVALGAACETSHVEIGRYVLLAAVVAAAIVGFVFAPSHNGRRILAAASAVGALSGNLIFFPFAVIPLADGDYFSAWNLNSHKVLEEISRTEDITHNRTIFRGLENGQRWSMNASYYGFRTLEGYFNPLPYEQFTEMYDSPQWPVNYEQLLGVKYLLCQNCESVPADVFHFEREISGSRLYASNRAFPHYGVMHEISGAYETPAEFFDKVALNGRYLEKVLVQKKDFALLSRHLKSRSSGKAEPCAIEEKLATADRLSLSISCSRPGLLLLNEYFSPNWIARINDQAAETYRVNLSQIALPLGGGRSAVEFEYRPAVFYRLRVLGRITGALVLLWFFLGEWRMRQTVKGRL